jgi:hypothetical protein
VSDAVNHLTADDAGHDSDAVAVLEVKVTRRALAAPQASRKGKQPSE